MTGQSSHICMRPFIIRLIVSLISVAVITACSRSPNPQISATPISGLQPTATLTSTTDERSSSGDVYLVLSTASAPYHYRLARLPGQCLLIELQCPPPEFISGFPETEYSQSALFWSPDGRRALFFNSYNSQLLAFDPRTKAFEVVATDLPMITNEIRWSPNGKQAAIAVQGPDAYSSDVVIIGSDDFSQRKLTTGIDGLAYPLGWHNDTELVLFVNRYGLPGTDPSAKKVVTQANLYTLNMKNSEWLELALSTDWLDRDYLALSPEGSRLVSTSRDSESSLFLMNIDNASEGSLGMRGMIPKWSPDGRWIAGARQTEISKGVFAFDVYVVPLEGSGVRPIFHSESYRRIFWLPDSRHLLLIDPDSQNDSTSTPLEIVSIEDGGGVRRSIELNAYTGILELSWQP